MAGEIWTRPDWQAHTELLLDSFRRWLGRDLVPRSGEPERDARALFETDFVVVSHGIEDDPILNYANLAAITLWETDLGTLLSMPSRKTAEPLHRDERASLLQRVTEHGFIDDYRGIRISATGRRFRIERAIVWNLLDTGGGFRGQAATFSEWEEIE